MYADFLVGRGLDPGLSDRAMELEPQRRHLRVEERASMHGGLAWSAPADSMRPAACWSKRCALPAAKAMAALAGLSARSPCSDRAPGCRCRPASLRPPGEARMHPTA